LPTDFDRDTAAEPLGAGRHRVRFDPRWRVVRGPNGGYVAAVLVNAIKAEVDPARQLRSLSVHYLAAPEEADAEVHVRVERAGRSLTSVSARCEQNGRTVALALAALATPYPSGLDFQEATMPEVAPPETIEAPPWEGATEAPPFSSNFVMRPALGAPVFSGGERAHTGGWLRLRDERPIDEALLVAFSDSWWPAVYSLSDQPLLVPTIDLTVHLRAELPRPQEDVLVEVHTDTARHGFLEEDTRIFARDGTLLSHSRQLALAL
jgi:acyl-CoA thioesterase